MYKYSKSSTRNIESCHEKLQLLAYTLIAERDCTALCGHRSNEEQALAYRRGASKAKPGQSKHNVYPSRALDIVPVEWLALWAQKKEPSEAAIKEWGDFVLGIAKRLNIKLRWGYDWDGDGDFHDQTLHDAPHFELLDTEK